MVALHWIGHASFMFESKKKIRVFSDPWNVRGDVKADVVIVTHSHFDHFSIGDIEKLRKPDTLVILPGDCKGVKGNVKVGRPGDRIEVTPIASGSDPGGPGNLAFELVPAYTPKKQFHPRANDWYGFVLTMDGERIYQAGDTDLIPEMASLKNIDIAILPIGGTYTMDPAEAARAVEMFNPKVAIPFHYGEVVGSPGDAREFARLCKCKVEVMQPEG